MATLHAITRIHTPGRIRLVASCRWAFKQCWVVHIRDRGDIFGLTGQNAELPRGRGTGWGNNNRKSTNLRLQFLNIAVYKKTFFTNWCKTQYLARNYNTVVKTCYSSCFERNKKLSASIEMH